MTTNTLDTAKYNFIVDTSLLSGGKFKIVFVWNNGDTGILKATKAGTYVVSIKGWFLGYVHGGLKIPNSTHTALRAQTNTDKKWSPFCYFGVSDGFTPDTTWSNLNTYTINQDLAYNGFNSGKLDTVVISNYVKPVLVHIGFIDSNGKAITLNKWYYNRQIKGW